DCVTTTVNGKWDDVDVSDVAGRDIIVLEDADKSGVTKALKAAQRLHGAAKTLRVVRLPGHEHTAEKHGEDISDWLDEDPTRDSDRLARVCFEVPLDQLQESWLRLQYAIDDDWTGQTHEIDDRIFIVSTRPPFGGLRWWFLCPRLNHRVRKLYLPLGGRHFRSRQAYGLVYPSQRETVYDR